MRLIASALPLELRIAKKYRKGGGDTDYLQTGIGSAQTIFSLTKYLTEHKDISEILFFGICGYLGEKLPLVQIANAHHRTQKREYILATTKIYAPLVTILTSDTPVHDRTILEIGGYDYVDMESWGVALVADKFQLPCTILRAPYDEIGSISCVSFDKKDAEKNMILSLQQGLG